MSVQVDFSLGRLAWAATVIFAATAFALPFSLVLFAMLTGIIGW